MRIGIIGAGAVGGALAALLDREGHTVEVTARGDHLAAIRADGLHLTGAWGDHVARVEAGEVLSHGPELAIAATKAQDAVAAIRDNVALLRGVPVLVVQNGLDGIRSATDAAPRSDIVGGLATFATSYLSPGVITVTATGTIVVGVLGDQDLPARYVARIIDSVIPTTVIQNFAGAQWTKLVINQVNALPAITGRSVQEVVAHAGLRRIMTASIRETVRIGRASRVRFEPIQGLGPGLLRFVAAMPLAIGAVLPRLMSARAGRVPNPGSTLQSIRRGQATEIDYLNGAVVRAAEAIGRTAPVNAALVDLVHEVEGSGEFLTPAEVVARVRV
jgi:2-dehydropantoate 2-reductase